MSFLALESALVERLKARLPAGVHVLTAADLEGVTAGVQPTPAVHVVYRGYRVKQGADDGTYARIEQTWFAVVAVRNVQDVRSGLGARDVAGPLMSAVCQALMGWCPDQEPMRLTTAPLPGFNGGHLYAPLAFLVDVPVDGGDPVDLASLADFITFSGQIDIPPHASETEHDKWLVEPPDYTTTQPDAQVTVTGLDQ